jgi:4-hydroxybenzoate polyprenyltransferase
VTTLARRPRWYSFLLLSRFSNLPTVWTNVLAGMCAVSAAPGWATYVSAALAASLFYMGGMFLNDAFDAPFDRAARPTRPIPAGDVSRQEVFATGAALLLAGELLLLRWGSAALFGLLLAAAILLYNARHKGDALAPVAMGACRGLVYLIAAAAAGAISRAAAVAALMMVAYVSLLTVVAKMTGAEARRVVPLLIAGISLLDAAVILATSGSFPLTALAVVGFGLTLALQRVVPGD